MTEAKYCELLIIILPHHTFVMFTRCRVKVTGDMMMSFPAGIVRVLADSPSPAVLTFRIRNTTNLEHILVNSKLLTE